MREHGDVILRLARWLMQHRAMDGDDIDVRSRWEDFMAQMKMLSTVFTLLLSSSASAQETTKDEPVRIPGLTKYEITRYVVSGKKQTIEFVYGAYPDCSPLEWIEIRKLKEPEHGAVEIAPGEHFNNDRTKCGNGKKIRGQMVSYKSSGRRRVNCNTDRLRTTK